MSLVTGWCTLAVVGVSHAVNAQSEYLPALFQEQWSSISRVPVQGSVTPSSAVTLLPHLQLSQA